MIIIRPIKKYINSLDRSTFQSSIKSRRQGHRVLTKDRVRHSTYSYSVISYSLVIISTLNLLNI